AATYTNLAPGNNTFEVKASSRDAVWSEPVSLEVKVLPPWWRTIWAYLGYLAFMFGGVVSAARIQRARISAQEREKVRQKELEQAREIEKQHVELSLAHETLKKTQGQLVEQEKLASLGSLTAGIAHEIKNPLNFVNNFAEVGAEMADELSEAIAAGNSEEAQAIIAELRENAKQITKHGRRADEIVKAMMQHARGGASEREEVQLNTFLEEYANLAWHGMRAKDNDFQAELVRDFDPLVGSLKVMPQELGRVVLNLLNNAFDAVRGVEGARVTIASRQTDGHVSISVSDNGPGIPDAIRDKIFEPFFTTKPTGEGTGLGLSLSYDIITKGHGGSMTVGLSAEGGALFTIDLQSHP
ncbi:GHKL domain-containing protein, partial [bacterium]|nr:GHKL domain-containing protein [bacterium]